MKIPKTAAMLARQLALVLFHNDDVPQGGIWIRLKGPKAGVYTNVKDQRADTCGK